MFCLRPAPVGCLAPGRLFSFCLFSFCLFLFCCCQLRVLLSRQCRSSIFLGHSGRWIFLRTTRIVTRWLLKSSDGVLWCRLIRLSFCPVSTRMRVSWLQGETSRLTIFESPQMRVGSGGASSMPPQQRNSIEINAPGEWKP